MKVSTAILLATSVVISAYVASTLIISARTGGSGGNTAISGSAWALCVFGVMLIGQYAILATRGAAAAVSVSSAGLHKHAMLVCVGLLSYVFACFMIPINVISDNWMMMAVVHLLYPVAILAYVSWAVKRNVM